jgi:Arc/MetJ-type ribon-helix-helix transcriptional regulator
MEKETEYTTVSIPKPLAEKIKQRIEGTGFRSVSEYVIYVLREVLASLEEEERVEFTEEEEEEIKRRLKALGYM